MKEITLTQGKVALVDDEDFSLANQFVWFAVKPSHSRTWYAQRNCWKNGKRTVERLHTFLVGISPLDHKNGDGLDNRRENLRPCTLGQNQGNARRRVDNTSGFKGVTWSKRTRRWRAEIRSGGVREFLGYFDSAEEAARAYDAAAPIHFGEFAKTNC